MYQVTYKWSVVNLSCCKILKNWNSTEKIYNTFYSIYLSLVVLDNLQFEILANTVVNISVCTAAHLLISQSRSQTTAQGDNDLLNALNTIRQCMEEVMDIVSSLKPILQVELLSSTVSFYNHLKIFCSFLPSMVCACECISLSISHLVSIAILHANTGDWTQDAVAESQYLPNEPAGQQLF